MNLKALAQAQFNAAYVDAVFNHHFALTDVYTFEPISKPYMPVGLLQYDYLDQPISEDDVSLVSSLNTLRFGFGLGVEKNFFLSADSAIHYVKPYLDASQSGTGDTRFQLFWGSSNLFDSVGGFVGTEAIVPTAQKDLFLGNGDYVYGAKGGLSWRYSRLLLAGTLAYRQVDSPSEEMNFKRNLRAGGGVSASILPILSVSGEWFGQVDLDERSREFGESFAGTTLAWNNFSVQSGVSWSGFDTKVNSRPRVLAILKYQTETGESTENKPERRMFKVEKQAPEVGEQETRSVRKEPRVKKSSGKVEGQIAGDDESKPPACSNQTFTQRFFIRSAKSSELSDLQLPYYRQVPLKSGGAEPGIPVLSVGQMTGRTKGGLPYVEDGQVVFAVEVKGLPERRSIVSVDQVHLHLDLVNYSKDDRKSSEIFCYINERICSGYLFQSRHWVPYISKEFFRDRKVTNTYFSETLKDNKVSSEVDREVYSYKLALDLRKIVEADFILSDLIYEQEPSSTGKVLHFVVADDVFVSSDAALTVAVTTKVCN